MPLPNPVRYEVLETLPAALESSLPSSLKTTSTPVYYKAMVMRLLAGTLRIRCNKTATEIDQFNNYSVLRFTPNTRITKTILVNAVKPKSLGTYDKLIMASSARNRRFYTDIFFEFCGYFFNQANEHHTAAFVHLYRILERISYAVPLIWAARAREYEATFQTLKSFLTDTRSSELAFFKKFVPQFIDSSYLDLQVNLNVLSVSSDWQERHFETLQSLLKPGDIVVATPFSQITITYRSMLGLIITIRNKYFHALTGLSQSFGSKDVADFNEFCFPLNEEIANWLAFILFEIFEFEAQ